MKKIITPILLFIVLTSCKAQTPETIVNNFVKSVFFEKSKAKFIADNYMYFESIDNAKYTIAYRVKILDKHLKKIKKEKSSLIDSANYSIIEYKDYEGTKVTFNKSPDSIFILVSKNNPVMYFYLLNDKIFSFDYILKGDEGLFITY